MIEALSDPRGNVKAGTKVSYWMAYAHGISWCHSSCFSFLPANDRCNNEESVPVVIVIVTAVIIRDDVMVMVRFRLRTLLEERSMN